jgi:dihydroflavonol-4-reductase
LQRRIAAAGLANTAMALPTIGITGANGFIGAHLLRSAVARGLRPIAFVQRGSSLAPIADLAGRCELIEGDLREPASVDAFVARCGAVFHLAGLNRYWVRDRTQFHAVNVAGVRCVAEACVRHRVERLVHASSCITLGASDAPVPRDEDAPYNLPFGFPYGETKKAGEDEIKQAVRERGLPAVIVHPASAIGEQDFAPTPIGQPIADIARGRWPVYVAGGACFIDVHDVVRGLWLAMERGELGRQYLLAGENLTHRQFMTRVAELAGVAPPRVKLPRPLLDVIGVACEWAADHVTHRPPPLTRGMTGLVGRFLFFDGARAERELGFRAGPVAPAIERCLRWFREARREPEPRWT